MKLALEPTPVPAVSERASCAGIEVMAHRILLEIDDVLEPLFRENLVLEVLGEAGACASGANEEVLHEHLIGGAGGGASARSNGKRDGNREHHVYDALIGQD
jgi:hypothetical protein